LDIIGLTMNTENGAARRLAWLGGDAGIGKNEFEPDNQVPIPHH
jgi:hypothetical protein